MALEEGFTAGEHKHAALHRRLLAPGPPTKTVKTRVDSTHRNFSEHGREQKTNKHLNETAGGSVVSFSKSRLALLPPGREVPTGVRPAEKYQPVDAW